MKKVCKIAFFVSLALALILIAVLTAAFVSAENENTGSVGIIGGADGPTAVFVTRTLVLGNPLIWALCFCGVLLIASAIGWIVTKKK